MPIIMDIECIISFNNKYLIKELSAIDVDSLVAQHWIFKHSEATQNAKSRCVNRWLERHYHRLSLDHGDVDFTEIGRILNSFNFTNVYVKGEQKQRIIQEYIPHVQDIEVAGCPRMDQLLQSDELYPRCLFHENLNIRHCTFQKIYALRKWFSSNRNVFN